MELRFDLDRVTGDPEKQEQLKDYLELVDFLMRETLSPSSGPWLKGSLTGY